MSDEDKDDKIADAIKKEGDKVRPKDSLPEIRAKIKAGQEKSKKTGKRDDKRRK
jgi:hypothetical protein